MAVIECRYFNGYKPCSKNDICDSKCQYQDVPLISILIVHLGALGAVVRSTSILRAIKRKYPSSMITWVTDSPAHHLLKNHPAIDRVLVTSESDLLQLGALQFEIGLVIDKSLKAVGVLRHTAVDQVYGFINHSTNGAIIPATGAAEELWRLGLDNDLKFHVNTKPETQLLIEALELGLYQRDDYWLPLTSDEKKESALRRRSWLARNGKAYIIGVNTGCSDIIPYKKLTVAFHQKLIKRIKQEVPYAEIVLLGGPEDTARNKEISEGCEVVNSETQSGLRDGLISVASCDTVITGDSLGMHMAISQKKQVIAWFGPTCAQEIDLYDRGIKIQAQSSCSPCWKRTCEKSIMCYDQVSLEEIIDAVKSCRTNSLLRGLTALHSPVEKVP